MRELLKQIKRVVKHSNSILYKLVSKLMSGAKLSAKLIAEGIVALIVMPFSVLTIGVLVSLFVGFSILSGTESQVA